MAKKTPPAVSKQPSWAWRADIILCLQDDPTNSPFPAQGCRTLSWARLALFRLVPRGGSPRRAVRARLWSEASRIVVRTRSAAVAVQPGPHAPLGRAGAFPTWRHRAGAGARAGRTQARNAIPWPARTSAWPARLAPLGLGRVERTFIRTGPRCQAQQRKCRQHQSQPQHGIHRD